MIRNGLALSILSIAAAFPSAWGEGRSSKLDCPAVNGLVSFCQLRATLLQPESSFAVNNVNGNITVTTWSGPGISIRAEVETAAESQALAEELAGQVNVGTAAGSVTVKGPATNSDERWSVQLEIEVPAATGLTIADVNGDITIHGVQSAIDFDTVNGNASLHGVTGDVAGSVVNGSILIEVGGDRWAGQTLDLDTVNGSVEIEVPADCATQVTASLAKGTFSTNFPVDIPTGAREISFELGNAGGSAIRVATSNGNIALRNVG
jgi:DUF4097 and DUF4098 domain-containing protein YvlB